MQKLDKSQFCIAPHSHGVYKCAYYQPLSRYYYVAKIYDMGLIDDVKPKDYPTQAAMRRLARAIRSNGVKYNADGYRVDE